MAYLLDANVFIGAKDSHYGFDFCPAFWDWLLREHRAGRVYSIEKVGGELLAGDDELAEWARARGDDFFLCPDATLGPALTAVSTWATAQDYEPGAINTFFQAADYYLVEQAYDGQHTVVTHEVPADSPRKIKIPNVCRRLDIEYLTPYEMLRRERARFVLSPAQ